MSYFRHGDPLDDFESYERDRELERLSYPFCSCCGRRILDNKLFDINDNLYHIECAEDEFCHWTENYME